METGAQTEAEAGAGSGVGARVRVRTGVERGLKDSIGPHLAHTNLSQEGEGYPRDAAQS